MTRTKWLILMACVLSLGAGVAVGMLRSRTVPPAQDSKSSWLARELSLTADQQQQMEQIWNELLQSRGEGFRRDFMVLQQEREAAIAGLFNAEQSEKYEQINQQFMEKMKQLWKRVEQDFLAASEKTRQLLNESQRERYDILVRKFQERQNSGEWFGMGPMGRGASTRPGNEP